MGNTNDNDRYKEIIDQLVPALNDLTVAEDGIDQREVLNLIKGICKTPDEILVVAYLTGVQMGEQKGGPQVIIVGNHKPD